jgi:hypothetical protein
VTCTPSIPELTLRKTANTSCRPDPAKTLRPSRDPGDRVCRGAKRLLTAPSGRYAEPSDLRGVSAETASTLRMPPPGIEPGHAV